MPLLRGRVCAGSTPKRASEFVMAAQLRFATRQLEELAIAVRRSCRLLHGRSEHERQVARSHDVPSVGDDFGTGTRVEIRTGVGVGNTRYFGPYARISARRRR